MTTSSSYDGCLAYLPEDHRDLVKYIDGQVVINCRDEKVRMYGSRQELFENVRKFLDFAGTHQVFGTDLTEPINTDMWIHRSLKDNRYFYKQDALRYLAGLVSRCDSSPEIDAVMGYFFRAKEQQMNGIRELTRFQKEAFDLFEENLKAKLAENATPNIQLKDNSSIELVFEEFKKVLPLNMKDPGFRSIHQLLNRQPVVLSSKFYQDWINKTILIIESVQQFIMVNQKWFTPTSKNLSNFDYDAPAIVRLFIDGNKEYFLNDELNLALLRAKRSEKSIEALAVEIQKSGLGIRYGYCLARQLEVDDLEEVNDIEFVPIKIPRTKYRAIYIPTLNDGNMITAIDALSELFHDLVSVKKLFQNVCPGAVNRILKCAHSLINFVGEERGRTIFLSIDDVQMLTRRSMDYLLQTVPDIMAREKLEPLTVGPQGFTQEDLEDELERMGLAGTFPNVFDYTEEVFKMANEKKARNVLRTCDMYDALEKCQLICLVPRGGIDLGSFIHAREGCSRLWLLCEECIRENKLWEENDSYSHYQRNEGIRLYRGRNTIEEIMNCSRPRK